MTTKVCSKCKVEQLYAGFYFSKRSKDHLQAWCRSCTRSSVIPHQLSGKRKRAPGQTVSKPKAYKNREARGKAIRAAEKAKRLELMRDVIQFQGLE